MKSGSFLVLTWLVVSSVVRLPAVEVARRLFCTFLNYGYSADPRIFTFEPI